MSVNFTSADLKSNTKSFLRGFLCSEQGSKHAAQGLAYLQPLSKRKRRNTPIPKKKPTIPAGTELLKRVPPTAVRELADINPFHSRPPKHGPCFPIGHMEQGHGVEWQSVHRDECPRRAEVSKRMFKKNAGCQYEHGAPQPPVPPIEKRAPIYAPYGPPSCYDPEWRNYKTPAQTPHVGMEKQAGWWVTRDDEQ